MKTLVGQQLDPVRPRLSGPRGLELRSLIAGRDACSSRRSPSFDREAYVAKARNGSRRWIRARKLSDAATNSREPRRLRRSGIPFGLLKSLPGYGSLLAPIRRRVAEGMPYVGSSAGSHRRRTDAEDDQDMPIVQPHPSKRWRWSIPDQPALPRIRIRHRAHGENAGERILQFLRRERRAGRRPQEGGWIRVEGSTPRRRIAAGARLREEAGAARVKPGAALPGGSP